MSLPPGFITPRPIEYPLFPPLAHPSCPLPSGGPLGPRLRNIGLYYLTISHRSQGDYRGIF